MLVCLLRGGSRLPKTAPAPSAEATDAEAHPTSTCFGADFRANTTPDSWTSAVHRAPCLANCRTHPDLGMGRPRSRALTSRATKKACGRRALAQRLALEHHEGGPHRASDAGMQAGCGPAVATACSVSGGGTGESKPRSRRRARSRLRPQPCQKDRSRSTFLAADFASQSRGRPAGPLENPSTMSSGVGIRVMMKQRVRNACRRSFELHPDQRSSERGPRGRATFLGQARCRGRCRVV